MSNSNQIAFEDSDVKLTWGMPIEQLHLKFGMAKIDKGDRTIYDWGEQKILNGLKLHLTSRYWNFELSPEERIFDHLEFWISGDQHAFQYFSSISEHLTSEFGQPIEKNEDFPPEKIWKWKLDDLALRLSLFEQHVFKLNFKIKKGE